MNRLFTLIFMLLFTVSCMQSIAPKDSPNNSGYTGCISAIPLDTSRITVNFDFPASASEVVVHRDGVRVFVTTSHSDNSFIDSSLQEGQKYFYTCEATFNNKPLYGKKSVDAITNSINAPVFTGIKTLVSAGSTSVSVTWNTPSGGALATTYKIYGNPGAVLDWNATPISTSSQGNFASILSNLGDELPYIFGVRACSAASLCDNNTATLNITLADIGASRTLGSTSAVVDNGNIKLTMPWTHDQGAVLKRNIYVSTIGGTNIANYNLVQTLLVTDLSTPQNTYTYTSALENTTYYFIVRDEDPSLNNNNSVQVATVTTGDLTAPTFLGLSSLALNNPAFDTAIDLTWNSAIRESDNANLGANEYIIYANSVAGVGSPSNSCTSGTLLTTISSAAYIPPAVASYTLSGLAERTTYNLCVKAKDSTGNISNTAITGEVTTKDITKPLFDGIQAISFDNGTGEIVVSWNPSLSADINNYKIKIWKNAATSGTPTTIIKSHGTSSTGFRFSVIDFAFTDNDNVYVVVDACDNAAPSFNTQDNCTTLSSNQLANAKNILLPDTTPPAGFLGITSISVVAAGELTANWTAPADWTDYAGFRIYTVDGSNNISLNKICPCAGGSCLTTPLLSCTVNGLDQRRTYNLHVRPYDVAGNITPINIAGSQIAQQTTDTTVPNFTSNLSISNVPNNLRLAWNIANDNQYTLEAGATLTYTLYRKVDTTYATGPFNPANDGTLISTSTLLTFDDLLSGLIQGKTYYYTVCVEDASANKTCDGNIKSVVAPDTTPPVIAAITATEQAASTPFNRIWDLSWTLSDNSTANGALIVRVYRKFSALNNDFPTQIAGSLVTTGPGLVQVLSEDNSANGSSLKYANYTLYSEDSDGNSATVTFSFLAGLPSLFPTQIAIGLEHTCTLFNTGKIMCWGDNTYGQLGYGHTNQIGNSGGFHPAFIVGMNSALIGTEKATKVVAGTSHACALLDTGAVRCWGRNNYGQLGYAVYYDIGDNEAVHTKGNISLGGIAVDISADGSTTCALLSDGTARCWGYNGNGQLGDGGTISYGNIKFPSDKAVVSFLPQKITQITNGLNHTCVLLDNNTARCWGANASGQLGNGANIDIKDANLASTISYAGETLSKIEAGDLHTCVTSASGKIWCWGGQVDGRIGTGTIANTNTPPVTAIAVDNTYLVSDLAVGNRFSCAHLNQTKVKCFGRNNEGELGQGNQTVIGYTDLPNAHPILNFGAAVDIWKLFAGTGNHACAITKNLEIKCWGYNNKGQLGLGNALNHADNETLSSGTYTTVVGVTPLNNVPTFLSATQAVPVLQDTMRSFDVIGADDLDWADKLNSVYTITSAPTNGTIANCLAGNQDFSCEYTPNASFTGADSFIYQVDDQNGGVVTRTVNITVYTPVNYPSYVVKISSGGAHTCALLNTKRVRCWGQNNYGQLGYGHTLNVGDNETANSYGDVSLGGDVQDISLGQNHSCALMVGGNVKCWGHGNFGQLGYGNGKDIGDDELPSSVGFVNVGGVVTKITTGETFTCALLVGGTVRCWGQNWGGMLGIGNATYIGDNEDPASSGLTEILSPLEISSGRSIIDIYSGSRSSCAKIDNGKIRCWGYNFYGTLGIGNVNNIGDNAAVYADIGGQFAEILTPAEEGSGLSISKISMGYHNACALISSGAVRCWGYNINGMLGYGPDAIGHVGDNEFPSIMPFVKLGGTAIATDIEMGPKYSPTGGHTCTTMSDGNLRCWGYDGNFGSTATFITGNNILGDTEYPSNYDNAFVLLPGEKVIGSTVGHAYSCIILSNQTTRCWGLNNIGQLGLGNTTIVGEAAVPPTSVSTVLVGNAPDNHAPTFANATQSIEVLQNGSINFNLMPAVDTDWDAMTYSVTVAPTNGSLSGSCLNSDTDLACIYTPTAAFSGADSFTYQANDGKGATVTRVVNVTVSLPANFTPIASKIYSGGAHSCAVLTDGNGAQQISCWGENAYGQLGLGHTKNVGDATSVGSFGYVNVSSSGATVTKMSLGLYHTCALLSDGNVKCWGAGLQGQLGNGDNLNIGDNELPSSIADLNLGAVAIDISSGALHTCALLTDSTTKCWGANNYGQLGQATTTKSNIPLLVQTGVATYTEIKAGGYHTCLLTNTGSVKCWGRNNYGQLGYGDLFNIGDDELPSTKAFVNVGTTVTKLAASMINTCIIQTNGKIKCWGAGNTSFWLPGMLGLVNMQLNILDPSIYSSLVTPDSATNIYSSSMANHFCAQLSSKTICWGDNLAGQIGIGGNIWSTGFNNEFDMISKTQVVIGDVVTVLAPGGKHTCGVMENGSVKCWGDGSSGQLGGGNTLNIGRNPTTSADAALIDFKLSAANVAPYFTQTINYNLGVVTSTPKAFTLFKANDADDADTILTYSIVSGPVSGSLSAGCLNGIAGIAALNCSYTPTGAFTGTDIFTYRVTDSAANFVDKVVNVTVNANGHANTDIKEIPQMSRGLQCVLFWGGNVRCYGAGYNQGHGGFGLGTTASSIKSSLATDAVLGTTLKSMASLSFNSVPSSCGITSSGNVRCWGYNIYGQLANNDLVEIGRIQTPASIGDSQVLTSAEVIGGLSVSKLLGGNSFFCALLSDNNIRCWGYNGFGQLGYGHTSNVTSPLNEPSNGNINLGLAGGEFVTDLTVGYEHVCALLNTGKVKCWGRGNYFATGYASSANTSNPSTNAYLSFTENVTQIKAYNNGTCAVLASGNLICFGDSQSLGASTNKNLVGATVTKLYETSCADLSTGETKCWNDLDSALTKQMYTAATTFDELFPIVNDPADGTVKQIIGKCVLYETGRLKCSGETLRWGNENQSFTYGNDYMSRGQMATIKSLDYVLFGP